MATVQRKNSKFVEVVDSFNKNKEDIEFAIKQ